MSAEHFFFSFAWMCTRGPGFKSACNLGFVLKADVKVWGLFCIGRVFGSIKGLTVISEVAKGDPASVIILFTSIMELNIEEVIAGSRCTTTTTTTIASTQRGSSLIPPPFWGPQRDTVSTEERPRLRDLLRVGGLEISNMFGHNSINPKSLFSVVCSSAFSFDFPCWRRHAPSFVSSPFSSSDSPFPSNISSCLCAQYPSNFPNLSS